MEKGVKTKMNTKCSVKRQSQTNIAEMEDKIPPKVRKKTVNYNVMTKNQLIEQIKILNVELDALKREIKQPTSTTSNSTTSKSTQTLLLDEEFTFPCQLCIYNADNELDLRIHMDYAHDLDDGIFDSKITCKVCKNKFETKQKLMGHIRTKHVSSLPNCKYYQDGTCKFNEKSCWFPHKKDDPIAFKCRNCEEVFQSNN